MNLKRVRSQLFYITCTSSSASETSVANLMILLSTGCITPVAAMLVAQPSNNVCTVLYILVFYLSQK